MLNRSDSSEFQQQKTIIQRAFIVDFACIWPFGHNQGANLLFREALATQFDEIIVLVPTLLDKRAAAERDFKRELVYPYGWVAERSREFYRAVNAVIPQYYVRESLLRLEKLVLRYTSLILNTDVLVRAATKSWEKLFKKYAIGVNDLIFFPSSDYYGAVSLFELALKNASAMPAIHLRMVHVLEYRSLTHPDPFGHLMSYLRLAKRAGIRVSISAETPSYAAHLSKILGYSAFYFPYPVSGEAMPMPRTKPRMLSSIGAGRGEKGYMLLETIIEQLAKTPRVTAHCFEIQSMSKDDGKFSMDYQRRLEANPHVKVMSETLSEAQINDLYRRSYVTLMPYESGSYSDRGSAIYQEAILYGRPVVCFDGTGFADQVKHYGGGYVCRTVEEFVYRIATALEIAPEEWEKKLRTARRLYEADFQQGLESLADEMTRPTVIAEGYVAALAKPPRSLKSLLLAVARMLPITRIVQAWRKTHHWPVVGWLSERLYNRARTFIGKDLFKPRSVAPAAIALGPLRLVPRERDVALVINSLAGEIYAGRRVYPVMRMVKDQVSPARGRGAFGTVQPSENVWLRYFEPISYGRDDYVHGDIWFLESLACTEGELEPIEFKAGEYFRTLYKRKDFPHWRRIVHKAISNKIALTPEMKAKVDAILRKTAKPRIGVHLFGTDQWATSARGANGDYFALLDNLVRASKTPPGIFLSTHDLLTLFMFRKRYGEDVLCYDGSPGFDVIGAGAKLHRDPGLDHDTTAYEYTMERQVVDLFTLAACDLLVCTDRAIALACSYINPSQIQHFLGY